MNYYLLKKIHLDSLKYIIVVIHKITNWFTLHFKCVFMKKTPQYKSLKQSKRTASAVNTFKCAFQIRGFLTETQKCIHLRPNVATVSLMNVDNKNKASFIDLDDTRHCCWYWTLASCFYQGRNASSQTEGCWGIPLHTSSPSWLQMCSTAAKSLDISRLTLITLNTPTTRSEISLHRPHPPIPLSVPPADSCWNTKITKTGILRSHWRYVCTLSSAWWGRNQISRSCSSPGRCSR